MLSLFQCFSISFEMCLHVATVFNVINPLTEGIDSGSFLRKRHFLDILVLFRLHLSQICFNVLKNALASRQLGFLATSIAFMTFWLGHA